MRQSHTGIWTHLVISTKDYQPLFSAEWKKTIQTGLEDFAQNFPGQHIIFSILSDHIHFLIKLPDDMALSTLVNQIKKLVSDRLLEKYGDVAGLGWEDDYHAHSVSINRLSVEKNLIERQDIKHKEMSLQEELKFFGM